MLLSFRGSLAAMALVGISSLPGVALAKEPPAGAPPGKVEWKRGWDRFTPAEAAFTTALTVGAYVLDKKMPDYPEPKWDFEVPLLDPAVRGLFRARTAENQEVWVRWSDIGFRSLVLFPYIVDAGIVALGVHRNADVAAQLFFIDLQSLTFAGLSQLVTSRLTSRTRPFVQDCADDNRSARHVCGETREHRSFYGGHASAAFTSAGLTCLHHQHIPLYGGGAPDAWACVWALSFASLTAMARIGADEHWASDTVIGVGTGWLFGYLVPRWLHYGTTRTRPQSLIGRLMIPGRTVAGDRSFLWAPQFSPSDDGGVLAVRAAF
ncbi:MAG TPA: phosphatase PAP2 family protein [Labilithrix sp.]|nr:phosphatase PAP2 family protein [Labilithrix sp.]